MDLDFQTLVLLGTYLISIAGLYWKIRIDMVKLTAEIENIKCLRVKTWKAHDERREETEKSLRAILQTVNQTSLDMGVVKTHIEYLKDEHRK